MKCLDRKVFALCQFVATSNSGPRLVALVPQVRAHSLNYMVLFLLFIN